MIAYTHLMEWCHGYESLVSGLLFFYDGFMFVLCPILLLYVSINTNMFIYFGLILNIIALVIFLIFYFPESPVFLLAAGRFEQLKVVLAKLYKDNKIEDANQLKISNLIERYKA